MDPIESAARRRRVIQDEADLMTNTAANIMAAATASLTQQAITLRDVPDTILLPNSEEPQPILGPLGSSSGLAAGSKTSSTTGDKRRGRPPGAKKTHINPMSMGGSAKKMIFSKVQASPARTNSTPSSARRARAITSSSSATEIYVSRRYSSRSDRQVPYSPGLPPQIRENSKGDETFHQRVDRHGRSFGDRVTSELSLMRPLKNKITPDNSSGSAPKMVQGRASENQERKSVKERLRLPPPPQLQWRVRERQSTPPIRPLPLPMQELAASPARTNSTPSSARRARAITSSSSVGLSPHENINQPRQLVVFYIVKTFVSKEDLFTGDDHAQYYRVKEYRSGYSRLLQELVQSQLNH
ncbi:hypothetical protein Bca52824_057071 [Brassica carinata]|uniref:Uncharacterized protein n=1 Tax=Brassica carinata TaxID=52824 RepID=A0A8X7UEG1_BRACI|nr:hypothetical protein Bca52824_057071 [Brassica carinata]